MRKFLAVLLLLPVLALAQTAASKKAAAKAKPAGPAPVVVTPDKVQWSAAPPVFPPGAQFAVLAGDPRAPRTAGPDQEGLDRGAQLVGEYRRSEERRVGKECRSRWSPYH